MLRVRENGNWPNRLLEQKDGELLETAAPGTTGQIYSVMAGVEPNARPK
jgi:hypothetical protein